MNTRIYRHDHIEVEVTRAAVVRSLKVVPVKIGNHLEEIEHPRAEKRLFDRYVASIKIRDDHDDDQPEVYKAYCNQRSQQFKSGDLTEAVDWCCKSLIA